MKNSEPSIQVSWAKPGGGDGVLTRHEVEASSLEEAAIHEEVETSSLEAASRLGGPIMLLLVVSASSKFVSKRFASENYSIFLYYIIVARLLKSDKWEDSRTKIGRWKSNEKRL